MNLGRVYWCSSIYSFNFAVHLKYLEIKAKQNKTFAQVRSSWDEYKVMNFIHLYSVTIYCLNTYYSCSIFSWNNQ